MANCIKDISMQILRLTPTEAEINIILRPETLSSTTEARGRFVGPRCAFAATVEIAHPLREHAREHDAAGSPRLILRAIVPEPCLWDPESPFVYRCEVELWQDGQLCDRKAVDYGLAAPSRGA
jgi:beta-galactosidase